MKPVCLTLSHFVSHYDWSFGEWNFWCCPEIAEKFHVKCYPAGPSFAVNLMQSTSEMAKGKKR